MPPNAILLITGSELCRGETQDTNGPFLGRELTAAGVRVLGIRLVPDEPAALRREVSAAVHEADLVVTSGGLGPTADDRTVREAATALGREVVRSEEAAEMMRARMRQRLGDSHRLPENFFKQAEVITGADVLLNPVGLAPGSLVETNRGLLAVLPGVPRELRAMFSERLLPRLCEHFDLARPRIFRAKLLGVRESWAEERIQSLGLDFDRLEYGITAKPGELTIKLVVDDPEHFHLVDEASDRLAAEFGGDFVPLLEGLVEDSGGASGRQLVPATLSGVTHSALLAAGRTVVTAESCTGGGVAAELTAHSGSSDYLLGAIVAYANDVKRRALGVTAEMLDEHGAVSEPVCEAMCRGALAALGADLAVATTGIAGPGGGTAEKPVGLVFVGLGARAGDDPARVTVERHEFRGGREVVRSQAVARALDLLRREVTGRS